MLRLTRQKRTVTQNTKKKIPLSRPPVMVSSRKYFFFSQTDPTQGPLTRLFLRFDSIMHTSNADERFYEF